MANFQIFLEQADLKVRAGNILLLCVVSAVGFGVIGTSSPVPSPQSAAISSWWASYWGRLLPYSYASYRRTKRFQKFEELFPNAIDTLARAVRAGHAFTTALELIANEIAEPVASEFRKLFEEQKFGLPVRDALMNLAARVPLVDVKFFVTAVMLQRETGGNLAEILDNLSYVIRERFKIMRQVRVYTAQGRLTMMLLMGLPPIIVVVMLTTNPPLSAPCSLIPSGIPWWSAGSYSADHRLFRDSEDHSDSGLSYGAGPYHPLVSVGRRGDFFLRGGGLCAIFGAGRPTARPGLATRETPGKARHAGTH